MTTYPAVLARAPSTGRAIPRARLVDVVAHDDAPCVLLLGPAGSGKTTLAAQAVRATGARVIWVRLAPGYEGAAELVGIARSAVGRESTGEGATLVQLAADLLELLEDEPTLFVVDDYHAGVGEECDPLIGEVVALLPPTSRIVLCSRRRPAGLLGRVSSGTLRVVEADELAFTEDEAAALFGTLGRDEHEGADAARRASGWAVAVAAAAEAPTTARNDSLVGALLLDRLDESARTVARALAVLPYLTPAMCEALDIATASTLTSLGTQTVFVHEQGDYWRLDDAARDALAAPQDPADVAALRARAARFVADDDPPTAIDLYLDAGEPEPAADVLAAHLSEIGVRRAVHWLYRFPAELRHRFPPVVAFGKATVDLNAAASVAERHVADAPNEQARREALFALGSVYAHSGSLAKAADAFESAAASGVARARAWLGVVRFWAGDLVGADASLRAAADDAFSRWARGEIALASGDTAAAAEHAEAARRAVAQDTDISEAPALSLLARVALTNGDMARAQELAADAYALGVAAGGFDLGAAAPVHAWVQLEQGNREQAGAIAELLNARVGRHDVVARLQVALIRLALATDQDEIAKAERRVRDLRELGFAPVETQARALVRALRPVDVQRGLRVLLLGSCEIEVGDRRLGRKSWKSQKALEVLCVLALAGHRGATREQVIEAIWPDRDPAKGRTLLRQALSEIRRVLEPLRPAGEPSQYVRTTLDRLYVDGATDVDEARALASQSPRAALVLFRGPFLADDPYAEWADEERRAADTFRLELAERVAGDDDATREERAGAFDLLIEAEPWRDEYFERLAAMHRAAGDETAARSVERRRDAMYE